LPQLALSDAQFDFKLDRAAIGCGPKNLSCIRLELRAALHPVDHCSCFR
jgi:hypothetical protein